jgi:hypothetical protein
MPVMILLLYMLTAVRAKCHSILCAVENEYVLREALSCCAMYRAMEVDVPYYVVALYDTCELTAYVRAMRVV